MDDELRAYLDRRFDAIDKRLDEHDRRFAQIDERFAEVFARIDAVQASMFRRVDEMAATLEEHFREQQTEVLKAAFTLQEQVSARLRHQDNGLAELRERCGILERRLVEIEKRLLMPPQ